MNFILFLLVIPIILLLLGGGYLVANGHAVPASRSWSSRGIAFLMHMAVSSALHTILLAALYQYAADDRVPEGFDRACWRARSPVREVDDDGKPTHGHAWAFTLSRTASRTR